VNGAAGSGDSWFEQLEAKLEQQLEAFLKANPAQQELLQEQEQQERRQRLLRRRLELQQQAQTLRSELLELAAVIQQWQGRIERARRAGAPDLAERAEAHCAELMERGRGRWQRLEALGHEFSALEAAVRQADAPPAASGPSSATPPGPATDDDLERSWSRFEAEQELEELRRRHQA
jgi:hercynine metabolism protein